MSRNLVINSNFIGWNAGTNFIAASSAGGGTGQTTRCADMTAVAAKYSGNVNVIKLDWLGQTWMDCRISNPQPLSRPDGQIQMRHLLDGADYGPVHDGSVNVRVKVAASVPGQYCIACRNNGLDRSYLHPFAIAESLVPQIVEFTMPPPDAGGSWATDLGTEGLRVQFVMVAGADLIGVEGWNNGAMKMATPGQINMALTDNAHFRYTDLHVWQGEEVAVTPYGCEAIREAAIQTERNKFYYLPGSYDRRL